MSDGCEEMCKIWGPLRLCMASKEEIRREEASHSLGEAEMTPPSRPGGGVSRVENRGGGSRFSLH